MRLTLAALLAVALASHLWGIGRDLPYTPEIDEHYLVDPAVRIAGGGDLNPGWFGHPGSTVIYPLALLSHLWNALFDGGPWLHRDPSLATRFQQDPHEYYLLGRLLAVSYALASLPLVYLLGSLVFDSVVGLLGTWFTVLSPLAVEHAQMVRTDSAAVFFGLLALWLCARLYDRPGLGRQVLAGLAIGLAVATRYFMVTLLPVLVAVDVALFRRGRTTGTTIAAGLLCVPLGFAATTPYFFLDPSTVWTNLQLDARSAHPGADGLSFTGNLAWYVTDALPLAMTFPLVVLGAAGGAFVLWTAQPRQLLLPLFTLTFLVAISLSALHWARWIIELVPVLSLLAAAALVSLAQRMPGGAHRRARAVAVTLGFCLVSVCPAVCLARYAVQATGPSTRIRAREWIVQHVAPGTTIAEEWYTAPLAGTTFQVSERFSLAWVPTADVYRHLGVQVVVASSGIYDRYLAAPDRYPEEAAFYEDLFAHGHMLEEFRPSVTSRGPIIRIYGLARPGPS